jgi:hypothetical protein
MYDRPVVPNSNCAPLRSAGSFYYDYSEQFEDQPPWDIGVDVPLHPIPQRAENIRRSLLLMDDIQGRFDIGGNDSDSSKSNIQEVEKEPIESSHSSDAGDGNSERVEAKQSSPQDENGTTDIQSLDGSNPNEIPLIAISGEEQNQPLNLSNEVSQNEEADMANERSMMSDSATTRSISSLESPSNILEGNFDIVGDPQSRQSSQVGGVSKLRYSLDPALSDFASILSSFDRLGRVPIPKDIEVQSTSTGNRESSVYQLNETGTATLKRLSGRSPLPVSNKVDTAQMAYQKRHRRNIAAMRISTTGVVPDGFAKNSSGRQDDLPIFSPEPISPVRELRVKESIPQLMKALPPLPREAEKLSGYGTAGLVPIPSCLGHEPLMSGKDELPEMQQTPSSAAVSPGSQNIQPKFKIRVRASSPSSSPCKVGDVTSSVATSRPMYNGLHDYGYYSPAARPKLKLKMSRSQLSQIRPGQSGLSPCNNRLKQCNSLAELASCPKKDVVDEQIDIGMSRKAQVLGFDSSNGNSAIAEERSICFEPSPQSSPQPSDQFNIPYPPSPIKTEAQSSPITSVNDVPLVEACSTCYDASPSGPSGLRGKLSMLRLRFASPQRSTIASKDNRAMPSSDTNRLSTFPTATSKGTNATYEEVPGNKDQPSPPGIDKGEWRVKRWARDAKKAVRLYVKKTLDRSLKASA